LIFSPALEELYWAAAGEGFEYSGPQRPVRKDSSLTVAVSRYHHSISTEQFMRQNLLTESITIGAALKFGRMALGEIDIYPRFEGSKEWDTAAGYTILHESGGGVLDLSTHTAPLYNKKDLKNNFFIAYRSEEIKNRIKLQDTL